MRSTNSADYQHVPRPIAVMIKDFPSGTTTGRHAHARGQILYASSGLMIARTDAGTWAVPTGHALLIPPNLVHDIAMHGHVRMMTSYVTASTWRKTRPHDCAVVRVSRLLDAALEALSEEPVLYQERGSRLASVILDEVRRAEVAELVLPMPTSERLNAMCERLLADPGIDADIDEWARLLAVSRRTLTRHFARETGLSFGAWRRRLRQHQSLRLEAEGVPMKDIAARVGYQSPQALQAMLRRSS